MFEVDRRTFLKKLMLAGGLSTPGGRAILSSNTLRSEGEFWAEGDIAFFLPPLQTVIRVPQELLSDVNFSIEEFLSYEIALNLLEEEEAFYRQEPFGNQLAVALRRALGMGRLGRMR